MKSFAELIKPKVVFISLFIWGIFAGVMLIAGVVAAIFTDINSKSNETPTEIALIWILGSVGISLFIIILAVGTEYSKYKIKMNTLRTYPFTDLERQGYTETIFLKNNRWWFNENAYLKMIKGYPLVINSFEKGYVEMLLLIKDVHLTRTTSLNVDINEAGIVFYVPLDNPAMGSLQAREQIISEMIDQLKTMQIKPATDIALYDKHISRLKWAQAFGNIPR